MSKVPVGRDLAQKLIEEFAKNRLVGLIINTNKDILIDALASAEIPELPTFDDPVPEVFPHGWDTSDIYQEFSIRRILRNGVGIDQLPNPLQIGYDDIMAILGIYSSDRYVRRLLTDKRLVERMAESDEEFSLLGKLKTIGFDGRGRESYVSRQPVIMIAGAMNSLELYEWSTVNTTTQKGIRRLTEAMNL